MHQSKSDAARKILDKVQKDYAEWTKNFGRHPKDCIPPKVAKTHKEHLRVIAGIIANARDVMAKPDEHDLQLSYADFMKAYAAAKSSDAQTTKCASFAQEKC